MTVFVLSLIYCSDKADKKSVSSKNSQYSSLVDLVNPLMGTDSKFSLSNGNTYPAIAKPWVMDGLINTMMKRLEELNRLISQVHG